MVKQPEGKQPARRLSAADWQHVNKTQGEHTLQCQIAVLLALATCSNQLRYGKIPPAPLQVPTAAHCQLLQQKERQKLTCAAKTSQYCLPPSFHWLFSSCRDTKPAQMMISCTSSPQGIRCRACSRPVAAPCSVFRERLNLQGSRPQAKTKVLGFGSPKKEFGRFHQAPRPATAAPPVRA